MNGPLQEGMANDAVRCEPFALIYQYVGDRTPNRSPALKQINTGSGLSRLSCAGLPNSVQYEDEVLR